jgi:hypothetical protein
VAVVVAAALVATNIATIIIFVFTQNAIVAASIAAVVIVV